MLRVLKFDPTRLLHRGLLLASHRGDRVDLTLTFAPPSKLQIAKAISSEFQA